MKIVFILTSLFPSGGLRVVFRLTEELIDRNHDVVLFVTKREKNISTVWDTRAKISYPAGGNIPLPGSPGNLFYFIRQVRQVPECDVVIATYYPTAYIAYLTKRLRFPHVKACYFVQHLESLFCVGFMKPLKRIIANCSYRLPVRKITNSQWTTDQIRRVSGKGSIVAGLGIDLDIFHPPPTDAIDPVESGLIMTIGRHQELKGYGDFAEAMKIVKKRIPGIRLLVVSQEVMEIPSGLEGEVIKPLSDSQLVGCYHRAALFLSTSWKEGFGLPPLEAMACGTPVVTTDSGGIREFARDGENCLICPPRDPERIAGAVIRLLEDDAMKKGFILEGLKSVQEFTWKKVVDRFERALLNEG
jgi:glycosyltransferase involved in cell wall biosynthesis